MNLRDFVAETLKEILDGVTEAQAHYISKGGSIGSPQLTFRTDQGFSMWNQETGQPAQLIEFDVAVTATEGTETKGGIGVVVGPFALGSQGKSDSTNTSISRIKFQVPVFLPNR